MEPEIILTKKREEIENEKKREKKKQIITVIIFTLIASLLFFVLTKKFLNLLIAILVTPVLFTFYLFVKKALIKTARIKKMEDIFPDFIELVASNLRAGMTVDRALIVSSRKEFSPLDEEILNLGKDILTGKEISLALIEMAERTKSEKIQKTMTVINTGIKSGGNLAVLLELTAINMREKTFMEKRASSNVLMYVIFIFFAVSIGAPVLFSLSTVLVNVLTSILGNIPKVEVTQINIPFTFTSINISADFIMYFALIFQTTIALLASLLIGLVGKGEERAGLKYTIPLIILSTTVFFIVRTVLLSYFSDIIK